MFCSDCLAAIWSKLRVCTVLWLSASKFFCLGPLNAELDFLIADRNIEEIKDVYVTDLTSTITEDDLREHFEGCTEVRLPTRTDGKPKG